MTTNNKTKAVSPSDGPVAVTGTSGYIGSWIVKDLMEQGYQVRACVRDKSRPEKVDHLLALNETDLRGQVELFEADLFKQGSYDEPFVGCAAVIHTGAAMGVSRRTVSSSTSASGRVASSRATRTVGSRTPVP